MTYDFVNEIIDTFNTSDNRTHFNRKHLSKRRVSIPIVGKNYKTNEIKNFESIAATERYTEVNKKNIRLVLNKTEVKLIKNWYFTYPEKEIIWPEFN